MHRVGDEAIERDAVGSLSIAIRSSAKSSPKKAATRSAAVSTGGRSCSEPAVVREREMDVRMGEREPGEGFGRVPHLGLRGPQEFVSHRRVEKQVADFDRRAARGSPRANALRNRPPTISSSGAVRSISAVRLRRQSADFGDRRQRLAAEAERRDAEQIVGLAILLVAWLATASGSWSAAMPQPLSATRISSLPPCSTVTSIRVAPGVDGVLQQLFHHARRPLDHFARGDLVDDARGELLDGTHECAIRHNSAWPPTPIYCYSQSAAPTRTIVAPSRIATSKSPLMPIDRSFSWKRSASSARSAAKLRAAASRPPSKAAIVIRPQISTLGNWVAAASTGSTSAGAMPCLAASPDVFTSSKTRMGEVVGFVLWRDSATPRRSRPAGARCRRCGSARRAGACGGACCAGGDR